MFLKNDGILKKKNKIHSREISKTYSSKEIDRKPCIIRIVTWEYFVEGRLHCPKTFICVNKTQKSLVD